MAKSRIIKDLANGTIDIEIALKRAKVLLSEFDNADIKEWINFEISGYPNTKNLPNYRVIIGMIKGSYFRGSIISNIQYKNVSLPLGKMPDKDKRELQKMYFLEGIGSLKALYEQSKSDSKNIHQPLPADLFPVFNKYNEDPYMIITSAYVEIGFHYISNIISIVENKLLDSLLLLEKEFGNLDELDIDTSNKSADEIKAISEKIVYIINDNSINIGDNNSIKNSKIK